MRDKNESDGLERLVCLDTETTGLNPQQSRIVQIACLELIDGKPTGRRFYSLVNPGVSIPADASRVHGITNSMVSGAPSFADIVKDFLEFLGTSRLVIHNAAFDLGMINSELVRLGHCPLSNDVIDTLKLIRLHVPGIRASLDAGCRHFGISLERRRDRHDALVDVELLAELYGCIRDVMGFRARPPVRPECSDHPEGNISVLPDRGIGGPSGEERERHAAWRKGLGFCVGFAIPLVLLGCASLPSHHWTSQHEGLPQAVVRPSGEMVGPGYAQDGLHAGRQTGIQAGRQTHEFGDRVAISDGIREITVSDRILVIPGQGRQEQRRQEQVGPAMPPGVSEAPAASRFDRRSDGASRLAAGQTPEGHAVISPAAMLGSERQSRDIVDPTTLAVLSYLLGTQPMPAAMVGVRPTETSVVTGISPALRLLRE